MATHSRSAENTSCPPGLGFSGARGLASPCEPLRADLFERVGVEVYVKRDDLLSPHLSGNKARKLLHQLPLLKGQGTGATFGGASSTHLHAFALAGALEGFRTIGFVRQEASEPEGLLLQQARALGMEIVCLGRDAYRRRHEQRFHGELQDRFGPFHLIPEGGTNALGIQGIAELVQELPDAIGVVCCPFGTGGTAIGLLKGLQATQRTSELLVFSTLRPPGYAEANLSSLAQGHEVAWLVWSTSCRGL